MSRKTYWTARPEVPIAKAVRAGDFVFTSAYGSWLFDPRDGAFDAAGNVPEDGTGNRDMPFDAQVRTTFGHIEQALAAAGCTLADVVDCQVWLADARDFVRFNEIYRAYFTHDPPVRSVFPTAFMFPCKVEIEVIAWRPVGERWASRRRGRARGRCLAGTEGHGFPYAQQHHDQEEGEIDAADEGAGLGDAGLRHLAIGDLAPRDPLLCADQRIRLDRHDLELQLAAVAGRDLDAVAGLHLLDDARRGAGIDRPRRGAGGYDQRGGDDGRDGSEEPSPIGGCCGRHGAFLPPGWRPV
jgi:enamine deaminase RidA (YjgF/YER057c/UK114 family)